MSTKDKHIPPGWEYNPAAWSQRIPISAAASVGFVIAMYLSLYQWEVINRVWDPLFGESGPGGQFGGGSKEILRESTISQKTLELIKVPDAFLGALGYFADAVAGVIGGTHRWRTMPWIVLLFAVLVGPLGLVSVLLVVSQPLFSDAWCTLCLVTAVISISMIGPAMDEALASLQYLKRERERGNSLWKAFWGIGDRTEPYDVHVRAHELGTVAAERSSR